MKLVLVSPCLLAGLVACQSSGPDAAPTAARPDAAVAERRDAATGRDATTARDAAAAPDAARVRDAPGDAASGLDPTRLQAALDQARGAEHALGAALGVRTARGTWLGASGKHAPDGAAILPTERFEIGSVSKTFVAVLVLLEVERGRLQLDAPIAPWLPELPGADRITIRHLLQHTSGLAEYLANPALDHGQPATPRALLAWPATQPAAFAPGERHEYSNTNYIALGVILEAVAGAPLGEQIQRRIAGPLGLADTSLREAGTTVPGGFWYEAGAYAADPAEHPSVAWAAGAVVSTPNDLLAFFGALLGGTLLSPSSLAEMQTGVPIPESGGRASYGLGLMWQETPSGRLYFHGGLIDNTLTMAGGLADGRLLLAGYFNTMPTDETALLDVALGALP